MFQPNRLAVFAIDDTTFSPITRLPFYAEIVAPAPIVPDRRFAASLIGALRADDPSVVAEPASLARVETAVIAAIAAVLTPVAREELVFDRQRSVEFLRKALEAARSATQPTNLAEVSDGRLREVLETAFERVAEAVGLTTITAAARGGSGLAYPLGVLATDHAGYLSFDLDRLPPSVLRQLWQAVAALRSEPGIPTEVAVWLHAMGAQALRFDALGQLRFTSDAIVARIELGGPLRVSPTIKAAGYPALQAPCLTDWRLSPASFAASPSGLIGNEEGCEDILPGNLATGEIGFYQAFGLTDVGATASAAFAGAVQLGVVHEYRTAWYPLGHSLGTLLYALPLAPGESVNVAIVDWTRRDDAQRKEVTKLDEQLVNEEHRDRGITEAVSASLRELQQGSNMLAGLASAAGASGMLGAVGVAAGLAGSIGGGRASTTGSRDIVARTVQTVADRIAQASASQRELQSTVVLHSNEAEKEAVETRTLVNYNHSHTLTVMYYEVLRHYRIVTELVRRRPAVLWKVPTSWFDGDDTAQVNRAVRRFRQALQGALLDPGLAEAFDAVDRSELRRQRDALFPPAEAPPAPPGPAGPDFRFFEISLTTGDISLDNDEEYDTSARLFPKDVVLVGGGGNRLDPPGSYRLKNSTYSFVGFPENGATIRWGEIHAIRLTLTRPEDQRGIVSFKRVTVNATDDGGGVTSLLDRNYDATGGPLVLDNTFDLWLPTIVAPKPPQPPQRSVQEVQDDLDRARLVAHLKDNALHYGRAILLGMSPTDRVTALGAVAAHVDDRLLEFVGDSAAFFCTDPAWAAAVATAVQAAEAQAATAEASTPELDERLVTLPTRGVFADAKLGHCNASEEIDNTRFWDWQSSPIPHLAPEIAPVQMVVPGTKDQDATPTAFPSSLVNIVAPPAAPDPAGLGAAMGVLGTANIFRDMSGQAQTADLLMRLSDNSIGIAEAANRARAITARGGGTWRGPAEGTTGSGGVPALSGQRAGPNQPSAATRGLQDLSRVTGNMVRDGDITPEDRAGALRTALSNSVATPDGNATFAFAGDRGSAQTSDGRIADPGLISGVLTRTYQLPVGGEHECFPPSAFQSAQFASGFGTIAELLIEDDYMTKMGGSPGSTYFDKNDPSNYKDFLRIHNPGLETGSLANQLARMGAEIARPDIMRDEGVIKEYYEIKPMSVSGAVAGAGKIAAIAAYVSTLKLPYVVGTAYTPAYDLPILSGVMLDCHIGVTLNVQRHVPGIITYTICLQGELAKLLLKATIAAILAWIASQLIMLLGAGALVVA